jgi:PD-(D/E)XK nuclease family transposase
LIYFHWHSLEAIMSRFMDVTTDFGFKKLFGDEANLDLTMSFINDVLELYPPVIDLSLSNPEQLPEASDQRVGIYDFLCHDAKSSQYLVEMQKNRIAFVQDRMVYYSTFPITAQARKGGRRYYPLPKTEMMVIRDPASAAYGKKEMVFETPAPSWNYELKAIYCIAILGYALKGSITAVNRNSIRNDQPPHEPFYDKLKFVTVELPLFDPNKPEYSLDRHLNKWLYFLKHSSDFERIPDVFKNDKIFQKAFWIAELANLAEEERRHYNLSLKRTWDTYAAWETSRNEGLFS